MFLFLFLPPLAAAKQPLPTLRGPRTSPHHPFPQDSHVSWDLLGLIPNISNHIIVWRICVGWGEYTQYMFDSTGIYATWCICICNCWRYVKQKEKINVGFIWKVSQNICRTCVPICVMSWSCHLKTFFGSMPSCTCTYLEKLKLVRPRISAHTRSWPFPFKFQINATNCRINHQHGQNKFTTVLSIGSWPSHWSSKKNAN